MDDEGETRGVGVEGQDETLGLHLVAHEFDAGALEFGAGSVPVLAEAGLGLEFEGGFAGGELLDLALGLGAEAVLLLALHALPELLLHHLS